MPKVVPSALSVLDFGYRRGYNIIAVQQFEILGLGLARRRIAAVAVAGGREKNIKLSPYFWRFS